MSIITNKVFSEDQQFINICKLANVEPTKRQASKYRRKKGTAWKFRNEVSK